MIGPKRLIFLVPHVAAMNDSVSALGRQPVVVLVAIAVNLWQQDTRKSENLLITLREHLYYHVGPLLVAFLNNWEDLGYLLLRPVDYHISELHNTLHIAPAVATYLKVYLEAGILSLQRLEVVEEALLGEAREATLVFSDYGDFVFGRSRDVWPAVQRWVELVHHVDGLDAVEASEVVLLHFFRAVVTVVEENLVVVNNHWKKFLLSRRKTIVLLYKDCCLNQYAANQVGLQNTRAYSFRQKLVNFVETEGPTDCKWNKNLRHKALFFMLNGREHNVVCEDEYEEKWEAGNILYLLLFLILCLKYFSGCDAGVIPQLSR